MPLRLQTYYRLELHFQNLDQNWAGGWWWWWCVYVCVCVGCVCVCVGGGGGGGGELQYLREREWVSD